MIEFINYKRPNLTKVGKREYYLNEKFVLTWKKWDTFFRIIVPEYFNTDLGTTPFGIFNEDYMWGGYVAHDFLYYQNTNEVPEGWYQLFHKPNDSWVNAVADWKRPESDKLMNHVHTFDGAPVWKRTVVYRVVRFLGDPYWDS